MDEGEAVLREALKGLAAGVVFLAALIVGSCLVDHVHAACQPDLVRYTPTPTIAWDPLPNTPDLAGYRVFINPQGDPAWYLVADLPCTRWTDEDTGQPMRVCPGERALAPDWPVQRGTDLELETVQVCVLAYDLDGNESVTCTVGDMDPLTDGFQPDLCMTAIWQPGEPYQ